MDSVIFRGVEICVFRKIRVSKSTRTGGQDVVFLPKANGSIEGDQEMSLIEVTLKAPWWLLSPKPKAGA